MEDEILGNGELERNFEEEVNWHGLWKKEKRWKKERMW